METRQLRQIMAVERERGESRKLRARIDAVLERA
jgi:hypothetical protein